MPSLLSLGLVPAVRDLGAWVLTQMAVHARPKVESLLNDTAGRASRLGDLLVWDGAGGRRALAGLENLQDSQERIEQVIGRIESVQIGVASGLGSLTQLSMASLGVSSLAAGCMIWRMNALNRRLEIIGGQINDIRAGLNAQEQAHLQRGLSFLERFERTRDGRDLHTALEESNFATHLYRNLVRSEAGGPRRLVALNQCGRYYMLSLTAQARCLAAGGETAQAGQLLRGEQPVLGELGSVTFREVLGGRPETYLDPNFREDNVTLEMLAELYVTGARLGALPEQEVRDAADLFERLRPVIYGAGGWFRPWRRGRRKLLAKLKYLMACLEEIDRIESLRLRLAAEAEGRGSFEDMGRSSSQCVGCHPGLGPSGDATHVVLFE